MQGFIDCCFTARKGPEIPTHNDTYIAKIFKTKPQYIMSDIGHNRFFFIQIFEVDQEIHDECLKDIINASPAKVVLSGCLLEAKSLQPGVMNGLYPCVVLTVSCATRTVTRIFS